MEGIDSVKWKKYISHMMKELEYYLELDGITAPLNNTADVTNSDQTKFENLNITPVVDVPKHKSMPSASSSVSQV